MSDSNPADPARDNQPVTESVKDNSAERLAQLEADLASERAKNAEKSRLLDGSMKEALRLKAEKEALEKASKPDSELSEQEIFDKYLQNSAVFQENFNKVQEKLSSKDQEEYKNVTQEETNKFLEQHPEYKKENDPNDELWNALNKELEGMVIPRNPKEWGAKLLKAHRLIAPDNSLEKGKALAKAEINLNEQTKLGGGVSGKTPAKKLTPLQQTIKEQFLRDCPEYA